MSVSTGELQVRRAEPDDLEEITQLFLEAIRHMEEQGIHQWDEIYPNREVHKEDIRIGEQYVCLLDGAIVAAFVLNGRADPGYADGEWTLTGQPYMVLHRIAVHPAYQGRGLGARAVLAAEGVARELGARVLRLDAFTENPISVGMYRKLGYRHTGQTRFRKGMFYLYEKSLAPSD